jgi:hypothetical protein
MARSTQDITYSVPAASLFSLPEVIAVRPGKKRMLNSTTLPLTRKIQTVSIETTTVIPVFRYGKK